MQKVNLSLVGLKDFFAKVGRNLTWLFLFFFFLLLAFEVLEIKNSVDIAMNLNEVPPLKTEKGVKIDFAAYDTAVSKINKAKDFQPVGGIKKDPFSVVVQIVPAQ